MSSSNNNNNIYKKTSFLEGNNSSFIEELYSDYLSDPRSLPESWKVFFEGLKENKDLVYDTDPIHIFNKYYDDVNDLSYLDKNLYVDCMTWLTDDILVKVDRASMRHGLEVRCPYLDVELASYAASIPAELKMKGMETKHILKTIMFLYYS